MTMLWPEKPLGELADRIFVGIASAATHAYRESGVLLLRNMNIKDGGIDRSDLIYIDPSYEAQHIRKRLQAGDVLTVRTGYAGVSAVLPDDLVGAQCFTALVTRPNEKALDSQFLAMFLNSPLGEKAFTRSEAGGSQKNVNAGSLEELLIPTPPIEDQRQIAKVLSDWDTAIQKTEQLIAAKERHYTHELRRLISRGDKARASGEIQAVLGNFLSESREPDNDQDPAKRLTVRLHLQGVEARPVRGIESDGATAYFRRRAGQLIYGKQNIFRGSIGLIPPELDGYCSTQDLPAFDIGAGVDPEWLYYWLSRKDFYESLESLAAGSGSKRLHPEELLRIKIALPDVTTQSAVARYLNALREEINLIAKSSNALKVQKRGLMQKLLTGHWRLPVQEGAS